VQEVKFISILHSHSSAIGKLDHGLVIYPDTVGSVIAVRSAVADYGLDFNDRANVVINTAEIRGSNGETIDNTTDGEWDFGAANIATTGTLAAKKTISLRARSPEIIFYRQDPLLGTLYNTAIKNEYTLSSEELKVIASPFFISPQDEIKYQWTMNGQTMNFYGNEIILRKPNNQVGSTQIKLKLNNLDSILQFIDNDFLIKFGE